MLSLDVGVERILGMWRSTPKKIYKNVRDIIVRELLDGFFFRANQDHWFYMEELT